MPDRTRYAIVGLGGRSQMYVVALLEDHAERAELVGYCDVNQTRMNYHNRRNAEKRNAPPVPTFKTEQFEDMIRRQKVDCVIVTSVDRTHHRYIIRAMELGCDVICEKPMTVDAGKCQAILDAVQRTGKNLTVTFNYRYAPRNTRIRQLIAEGAIGDVISVHFEWLLDTKHGADYFRRWHRDKRNSGGLMVHKATHHFDLLNWWIDSVPETVFGFGGLKFYGRANAESRGVTKFYDRAHGHANAKDDPFALHLEKEDELREMYLEAEHEDGYHRDQSVFGEGISIEDDMAVLVRYRSGATMSYHLTAYSPWEGFRVAFNGTKGRLEYDVTETGYISGSHDDTNRPELRNGTQIEIRESTTVTLRPHWDKPIALPDITSEGGHGGADERLLNDIFNPQGDDPWGHRASHVDGAYSILTGIAANRSFETGMPVRVKDMVTI